MDNMFKDTKVAFALKSDSDLRRAHWLFKMIKHDWLVKLGSSLANFSFKIGLPIKGIVKSTIYGQFVGGETEHECVPVIDAMYSKGVSSLLDYSVEGSEDDATFDKTLETVLVTIDMAKEKRDAMPFTVFKPTGFGRFLIFQKITERTALSSSEEKEWERIKGRFDKACKRSHELGVPIIVDAEHSWMQTAADDLVEEMMEKYNKEKPIVYNTLQMYRHDRLPYLKELLKRANEKGYFLGMKIVRGAYLEEENSRAKEKGYPSPICATKADTDENYNACAKFIIEHIEKIHLFAGTHNEKSNLLIMKDLEECKIDKKDKRVYLAQLYGMSDHISFNLGKNGYNVAKYLPFGPVKEVLPYLVRRAEENSSVMDQTNRELTLIETELRRRKIEG